MTPDSITGHFHVLHFSYKLVNKIFVNNVKKTGISGSFPITHFLAKKRGESEPKNETSTRNKIQTASKTKTNNDYIWTCRKVGKWKNNFFLENSRR